MIEVKTPREVRSAIRRTETMANRRGTKVFFRDDNGRDWLVDRVLNSASRSYAERRIVLKGRLVE